MSPHWEQLIKASPSKPVIGGNVAVAAHLWMGTAKRCRALSADRTKARCVQVPSCESKDAAPGVAGVAAPPNSMVRIVARGPRVGTMRERVGRSDGASRLSATAAAETAFTAGCVTIPLARLPAMFPFASLTRLTPSS